MEKLINFHAYKTKQCSGIEYVQHCIAGKDGKAQCFPIKLDKNSKNPRIYNLYSIVRDYFDGIHHYTEYKIYDIDSGRGALASELKLCSSETKKMTPEEYFLKEYHHNTYISGFIEYLKDTWYNK